tara:strand:- start:3294 stop:4538 length:1245 start_codon:yes stop_codon:yes gene_type:complete
MNNTYLISAIKKSLISLILSFIIFAPITGFVLDEYNVVINIYPAIILSSIVFIFCFLYLYINPYFKKYYNQMLFYKQNKHIDNIFSLNNKIKICILTIIFLIFLIMPFIIQKYWLTILILALIYVVLGLGLNIVVGYAGLLDLGFVAFYAVGAYGYALGSQYLGLSFWEALPFCALLAALFGAILGFPVLKMHGDYLAIVTLGFGEIIRLILNNWSSFTHGPNGISVPRPNLFNLEFSRYAKHGGIPFHEYFNLPYDSSYKYIFIYFILLITVTFVIFFVNKLKNMPLGRAWEALREDEIAARSLGIYHVTTKLSAFSMGAFFGGLGGVFFAAYQGFIDPSSFTFIESALILAIVVLGGLGSILGVIIAAFIFTILPELLRDFANYRILLLGIIMVLMMIWRPRGLISIKRPKY